MQIEANKVVTFFYKLNDENGHELENNFDGTPMAYLHGKDNIFSALEAELEGLSAGDKKQVSLSPAQAYGEVRENSSKKVPIKHLLGKHKKLTKGQVIKINTEKGPVDGTVVKAGKFMVEVDFNHPLAGLSLSFDVEIKEVREATEDEIAHGHAHGAGGHHH